MLARPCTLAVALTIAVGCQRSEPSTEERPPGPIEATSDRTGPTPTSDDGALGAHASAQCNDAMDRFAELDRHRVGTTRPDFTKVSAAWNSTSPSGQSLREWMAEADLRLGRRPQRSEGIDVAAVQQALEQIESTEETDTAQRALLDVSVRVRLVAFLEMRRLLQEVSEAENTPAATASRDPGRLLEQWDTAYCLWSRSLASVAAAVDQLPARGGEDWHATIHQAFIDGRAGIDGVTHDPKQTLVARQVIEKGSYAVVHRWILARAEANANGDAFGAWEAGFFLNLLEDRLSDRNGPGLYRMREMLFGDPKAVDVAELEREMAIGFVKRARKYCDEAVTGGELGNAEAIKGAWEGRIYTRVILPSMTEALVDDGFDPDAYLADWEDYLTAVTAADSTAAAEVAARLVKWNCAYQDRLGITECTAQANE